MMSLSSQNIWTVLSIPAILKDLITGLGHGYGYVWGGSGCGLGVGGFRQLFHVQTILKKLGSQSESESQSQTQSQSALLLHLQTEAEPDQKRSRESQRTNANRDRDICSGGVCTGSLRSHKKVGYCGSQAQSCVASPVSERTAFVEKKILQDHLHPKKRILQSTYSESRSPIPRILLKSNCWLVPSSSANLSKVISSASTTSSYQYRTSLFVKIEDYQNRRYSTMANGNGSLARQNFHEECEATINKQINMELYASYVYLAMAYHFDREDVAFPGFSKWFKKNSDEEREHAEKLMKYQNKRGGKIVLNSIAKPTKEEWTSPLDAVTDALNLERTVNQTLLDLHNVAEKHNDSQLCDFVEGTYLEEQVEAIKELSDMITQLKRVGTGLGEHLFDKELLSSE